MAESDPDQLFLAHRKRLFGIAYRMLGSVADAEDVLQECWLRWHDCDHARVTNVGAYLTRTATNLSIDALRRLKPLRAQYSGPWLPQPIVEEIDAQSAGADDITELAQTLSIALLGMLESVPPHERATFVLREAFELSFEEIAQCLDAKPATCRQWSKRARERLSGLDWRDSAPGIERALLERFVSAIAGGDTVAMLELLDPDVVLISDGGGKVAAATRPLQGRREVSRFLAGITARVHGRLGGRLLRVNGGWGGVATIDGVVDAIYCIRARGERIVGVYIVRNPDKIGSHDQTLTSPAQNKVEPPINTTTR